MTSSHAAASESAFESASERLRATRGKEFWRCLEEFAASDDFQAELYRRSPRHAAAWAEGLNRRQFLTLMGASLALAGLSGCDVQPPSGLIVPYVKQPEQFVPGKPRFFATTMPFGGAATGLLVESHEGRPTKIEGNELHPASLGATDIFAQAAVLMLYDPDRSQTVTSRGEVRSWDEAIASLRSALEQQRGKQGAGFRLLTETITSPSLAAQIDALLAKYPAARWHQYDAVAPDTVRDGARLAFGEVVQTHYRFGKAEVIVSLDADFLAPGAGHLAYTREFIAGRRIQPGSNAVPAAMNRLYVVESTPSITGAKADHRWPLRAGEIGAFARSLAMAVDAGLKERVGTPSATAADRWVKAIADDLKQHRGKCLVLAGENQPAEVHAIAHAINNVLGNAGETVIYTDAVQPPTAKPPGSLKELADDMNSGAVELLLMVGGNPAYDAPVDFDFAERLENVALRAHLSLYEDETSALCHWHLPAAHFLEMWSDARAFDGTVSIIQPLIAPLYGGKSAHELLADLTLDASRAAYDVLRDYWRGHWPGAVAANGAPFETAWKKSLNDGLVENSAFKPRSVTLANFKIPDSANSSTPKNSGGGNSEGAAGGDLEIVFRPDASVYDGRFANIGWLQELPKPLTKLTWDNVALVSPATAERLGVGQSVAGHGGEHGAVETDLVELHYRGRAVKAPIWIMPGQPDESITVWLGYGRTRVGHVGNGVGFNAYALRTSESPWFDAGLEIRKTGERHILACTQDHHLMEHRHLVRSASLDEYRQNPHFAAAPEKKEEKEGIPEKHGHPAMTLYPEQEHPYNGYKWGMAIDLTACVGCNACVVACQAENNIPVVGKQQVTRGREMHWIRIDTYYQGGLQNPATHFQPVPCMQCENAPCELVCPVGATVHSDEGLNDMVYNRCVGTRYCSNNCPYKVRRFNFLQYSDYTTPSLKLLNNPEVTVRSRGVMEKCTYCVQRISEARIESDKADRSIRDGEVLTACQAVCPAEAIVFGDLNDPNSRVSKWKAEQLNYTLLEELNTRPRTTYLASLRNPNPAIQEDRHE